MPHNAAGILIEPPVSKPSEPKQSPAATAAAEPPLDPPVIRRVSQGLLQAPISELILVAPRANSCILSLPIRIAPASRSLVITVASYAGLKSKRIREPAVVLIPFV